MYNLNAKYCLCFVVLRGKPQGTKKIYLKCFNWCNKEQRANKTTVLSYGHIRSWARTKSEQMPVRRTGDLGGSFY